MVIVLYFDVFQFAFCAGGSVSPEQPLAAVFLKLRGAYLSRWGSCQVHAAGTDSQKQRLPLKSPALAEQKPGFSLQSFGDPYSGPLEGLWQVERGWSWRSRVARSAEGRDAHEEPRLNGGPTLRGLAISGILSGSANGLADCSH